MVADGKGNRLTPSHSTKGGKRYRYYLTRPCDTNGKRLCLPAHDVERIATEQWLQLLRAEDLDVQLEISDPATSMALRGNAERLAERWSTLDVPEQRQVFLHASVGVQVKDRRVEISAEPGRLASLLLKSSNPVVHKAASGKARRLVRTVDAELKKTAGETRILEEEKSLVAPALTPGHRTLLKAIAHGRAWARALIAGEVTSAEEIAARTGLSAAHVARGLKCMNISPDIVVGLVGGNGPAHLTWASIRPLRSSNWDAAQVQWRTSIHPD